MKLFKKFIGFLFPAHCVTCRLKGYWICSACLADILPAKAAEYNWIISVWNYKDPRIKRLLWKFKFENKFSIIEDLGASLYDHLSDELAERALFDNLKSPILVPIPLSRKSLRKRGYNQSKILAQELADRSNGFLQVQDILQKNKDTATQHSIKNRRERLRNLQGMFEIKNTADIKGKNIVLIDDITTTHGTLLEAKRVLRANGAKKILGFTIAH